MPSAPYIPFANECQAVMRFVSNGIVGEITQGYSWLGGGAFAVSDMAALESALVNWLSTDVAPHQCSSLTWYEVIISDLRSASGLIYTGGTSITGANTGAAVANQVCMGITFQTAFRGRSFRGRNYIAGLQASVMLGQAYWNATAQAQWDAAYLDLPVITGPAGWQHVILSRFTAGAPRIAGVATPVQTYFARPGIVTQRRRLT
jgi:hypothetical protein